MSVPIETDQTHTRTFALRHELPPQEILRVLNCINAQEWRGIPAMCGRITHVQSDRETGENAILKVTVWQRPRVVMVPVHGGYEAFDIYEQLDFDTLPIADELLPTAD